MKKFILFFAILFSLFSIKTNAQIANCNAAFTYTYLTPNNVKFVPVVNIGAPNVLHTWKFGDGTPDSTTVSPTHNYANNGIYTVMHIMRLIGTAGTNIVCADTITMTLSIGNTTTCTLQSSFTSSSVASNNLVKVFTNTSIGAAASDSIIWNFGDGSANASTYNATHTYANAGAYAVCLTIIKRNPNGVLLTSCMSTFCDSVTVTPPTTCVVQAAFNNVIYAGSTNSLAQYFDNASINTVATDSIRWTFGDGTSSNTFHAFHSYANFGTYNVCLRVIKRINGVLQPNCISEYCAPFTFTAPTPPCEANLNFSIFPSTSSISLLAQSFVNATFNINYTDSMRWSFGDGTYANTYNTTHTYATYGTYTVCFRVIRRINGVLDTSCIREICLTNNVVNPNPPTTCVVQAAFNNVPTPGTVNSLSQYFANTSTNIVASDSIRWTFGDGTSANTFNANHVYANYGIYNVCLRVIKRINGVLQPNCVSEICHADTIVAPANPCANLQPYFTKTGDTTAIPSTIVFTSQSTGVLPMDIFQWNFGDGTPIQSTTSITTPTHIYTIPGVYTVCLTIVRPSNNASTPTCEKVYCKTVAITQTPPVCNLTANFNITPALVTIPNTKTYINTSIGALVTDSIRWTFGDGTSSNVYSPTHTYANAGIYNVCLRIIKRNATGGLNTTCVSEFCKSDTITIPTPVCNLTASFNIVSTAASVLVKSYLNTSIGAAANDSIRWTFGDGTSSSVYSPTHTYANAGIYNVCLRIIKRNSNGVLLTSCIRETCKWDTITIPNPCNVQAYFSITSNSSIAPAVVQFTNQSPGVLPTDTIRWTFGDGTSGAGAGVAGSNPTHTYANAGTYVACIRISRQTAAGSVPCVREYCKTIVITAPITYCNISANFTWTRDSSVTIPNLYHFTNTTIGLSSTDSIRWSFGDGTFSNAVNPNHSYAAVGPYQVCVRVQKRNPNGVLMPNCISEKCYTVVVAAPTSINCNNVTLSYTSSPDPLYQNRLRFTAISNSTILNQSWTITKMPITSTSSSVIINQFNPTYAFLDSGYYRVCVKAIFANNCIKEYCNVVHIANPTPTTNVCNLQLYPNPASTVITGTVTLSQPLILYAFIYNSQNMLVRQKIQQGAVGINNVPVNLVGLPAGIYRYRLYYGFQTCVSTFMKQ
jgi:PKD repeat protein